MVSTEENSLLREPSVSVEPLYCLLDMCSRNYKLFCTICTAVKIGLFDKLVAPKDVSELAAEVGNDPGLLSSICEVLEAAGFLQEVDGCYQNSAVSALYLRADSCYCQHEVLQNLQNGFALWMKLGDVLAGGPLKVHEEDFFQDNLIHSLAAEALTRELPRTAAIIAQRPEFREAKRLLDLGGGHGLYAVALTRLNPNLQAYIFDFPEVLRDTEAYLRMFAADRVTLIPGNLFQDDFGDRYDMIFFSYSPGGKNCSLVPRIQSSLNNGGLFISKHAFYQSGEESKNPLLDIEWQLSS
jgi:precorrin-6B methylase 2